MKSVFQNCFECNKSGHIKDCPNLKGKSKRFKKNKHFMLVGLNQETPRMKKREKRLT